MTTTTPKHSLGNGVDWELLLNDSRVLLRQRQKEKETSWNVLSSAVLNGGCKVFSSPLQILNCKVPGDYDGVTPNPHELLQQFAKKEEQEEDSTTIGLLTAASMNSCCVATQQATAGATTIVVDAVVTAGISNSRAAGANANVFSFLEPEEETNQKEEEEETNNNKFGTINSIILTNGPLDQTALVEAYAVALEAKSKAMVDLGIVCAQDPSQLATGTGTDCTVLVCPKGNIPYAGKHTLLGELIGQAVYQATREALERNLQYLNRGSCLSPWLGYRWQCYKLQFLQAIRQGHRPLVPSQPMKPIPTPNGWVLLVGFLGVLVAFGIHLYTLQQPADQSCPSITFLPPTPSVSVLLAVVWGDRFLGSVMMPLFLHPVVLVGKLITLLKGWISETCFQPDRPLLGLLSGLLLFLTTVFVSVATAWGVLLLPNYVWVSWHSPERETCVNHYAWSFYWLTFAHWFLQVFLVRGAVSLQLLCNIALQMAHFLERHQLSRARDQLSWLCSRDPSTLKAGDLAGATLESLSENLGDSVVSPLVFYVLWGPLGAFAFRVMNTLDSRVGYRGRCEWVGKPSARWDDLLNLFPARLTALLLVVAAALLNIVGGGAPGLSVVKQGLAVAWRDASQCDSPNAGWPMATMAGILDVRLEKRDQYSLNGPPRGGSGKPPNHQDIRKGHSIAELAGLLTFLLAMVASVLLHH